MVAGAVLVGGEACLAGLVGEPGLVAGLPVQATGFVFAGPPGPGLVGFGPAGFGPVCSAVFGTGLAVFGSAGTAAAAAADALCLPGGGGGGGAAGGGPGHFGGSFGAAFGGVIGAAECGAPLEVVAISLGGGCLGRALRSILWRSCEKREKLSSMKLKL